MINLKEDEDKEDDEEKEDEEDDKEKEDKEDDEAEEKEKARSLTAGTVDKGTNICFCFRFRIIAQ